MANLPKKEQFPRHIGVVMDGNGRWAKKNNLRRTDGHREGAKVFRKISDYANKIGIECITFYTFSTENWRRPLEEVEILMDIFREYLLKADDHREKNEKKGYCLRFIGDLEAIPSDLRELMRNAQQEILPTTKTIVNVALNYGGWQEIQHSVKQIAHKVASGELDPDKITIEDIEKGLYTANYPDVDLIIRPSGEYRISNFLTWQSAYAELWFSNVLWPDFQTDDLDSAIIDFANRKRRFGRSE
ncbi:MAG: di-trans,poly-cis-decaprenylcistransferase [Oscillospiraceae bacterium]|jgi:undecaprenyl diphosphate synthase|nr:di-trans,poly-cis-decaprenylcistransferase [Oscillospiraceae bacterium]